MKKQTLPQPGTVLREEFMDVYQISVNQLSEDIKLSPSALRQIINNKLKIGFEVGRKLAVYFNTPPRYWIDMQVEYTLAELEKDAEFAAELKSVPKVKKPAAPKASASKASASKAADKKETAGKRTRKIKDADAAADGAAKKPRKRSKKEAVLD